MQAKKYPLEYIFMYSCSCADNKWYWNDDFNDFSVVWCWNTSGAEPIVMLVLYWGFDFKGWHFGHSYPFLGCINWYQSEHPFESSSFESMCSKVVLVFQFDFCFYEFLPNFHNARKFSNLSLRASVQPHSTLSSPSRTRPKLNPSCRPLHPCKLLPKLSLKLISVKLLAQPWHL